MGRLMDNRRIRILNNRPWGEGPLVYWMIREHRVHDNWALLHAQSLAIELKRPLQVVATPLAFASSRTERQANFLMSGLQRVADELAGLNISFDMIATVSASGINEYLRKRNAGGLVCDFLPMLRARQTITEIARTLTAPIHQVDAHNIVPCWVVSDKQEYAAYTIRPKINRLLDEFLTEIPRPKKHPYGESSSARRSESVTIPTDHDISAIDWLTPGETAGREALDSFLKTKLLKYGDGRNDPNVSAQSNLSPYLHFGFLAPQRAALEAQKYDRHIKSQEAFLEELIVRRELSDNFCNYNDDYETPSGFPKWAQVSLREHQNDPRPYLYTLEEFEQGATHDELWNAAQLEMVATGKMHGYLRMYWAKKILEWTPGPDEAIRVAISLNDTYSLDGNDPNGYTGIAWSIGGVHDRPWFNREIFGKVRFMSYSGCKRKFDIRAYVARVDALTDEMATTK